MLLALLTGCETPPAAPYREKTAEVFDLKEVDQAPVPTYQQRPRYPTAMRRAGASGGAMIRYVVDTEGKVRDARAIEAAHPDFAAAAVESVSGWKFKPGMKNGRPVNTRMQAPINFSQNSVDSTADYKAAPASIPAADIVPLESLDQKPVITFQKRPNYPFTMRRNGIAGSAVVDFIVDAQGNVQGATPVESTHEDFGPAAAAAVAQWKYRPGLKNGRAVATRMRSPLVFTLNEEKR
ncbi:MAG: TonB family protein [Undibacterium sp.]|nr:TonB family protein [Opitutaceae bacterium]